MTQTANEYRSQYNPVSWGTLLFSLWLTLIVLGPNTDYGIMLIRAQEVATWIILALSVLLFLSIMVTPISTLLKKKQFEQIFIPFVFMMSFLGFTAAWTGKFGDLFELLGKSNEVTQSTSGNTSIIVQGIPITLDEKIVYVAMIFGFIWFVTYLSIMFYSLSLHFKWLSVSIFVGWLLGSIAYLLFGTNDWGAFTLIAMSLAQGLILARILPISYSPFPEDEEKKNREILGD
jgi:hypothetical protein